MSRWIAVGAEPEGSRGDPRDGSRVGQRALKELRQRAVLSVVKTSTRLAESTLEAVLSAILQQNPTARVLVISVEGKRIAAPQSLPVTQHNVVDDVSTVQDLVVGEDLGLLSEAWDSARRVGVAQAYIRLVADRERRVLLYIVDGRPLHGGFVCVVADPRDRLLPELDQSLLRPRHCTVQTDQVGTFLRVDAGASQILGWNAIDLIGRRMLDFLHPQDAPKAIGNWIDMLAAPGNERRSRSRFRHRDGSWIWLEATNYNGLEDPQHGCVVMELLDISEEMASLEALRVSEQSLLRLADALPLGVLQIDRAHRVLYSNDRLGQIVGQSVGVTAEEHLANVAPSDCGQLKAALDTVLKLGEDENIEVRLLHRRGLRHCSIALRAVTDQGGGVTGAILCVGDVTEDVLLQQELRKRANYDRLTHCHNRVSIVSILDKALLEAYLAETGTGAIFVDLDHFKPINDELGHAAGDELLTLIASRLLGSVRAVDRVGRIGGDEFLVVCPNVDSPEDTLAIAERLGDNIRGAVELCGRQVEPSASIGVSWSCNGVDNAEGLIARADSAMYLSKSERRGRPVLAPEDAACQRRPSHQPRVSRLPRPDNTAIDSLTLPIEPSVSTTDGPPGIR